MAFPNVPALPPFESEYLVKGQNCWAESVYLRACADILDHGYVIPNERTGVDCHTLVNLNMEYNCENDFVPLLTTRHVPSTMAMMEMLGYLRGYSDAAEFRKIGVKTWDANANATSWLSNPYRKFDGDMGRVYGVQGRNWMNNEGKPFDQLKKIIDDLSRGVDDRGEIMSFWNPGELHMGCLRPCMHLFTFSKLGDTLHLHVVQRSADMPLGVAFNMLQTVWLLRLIAQITKLKAGKVLHTLNNYHIYSNQIDLMKEHVTRTPTHSPRLLINEDIKSLKDLETWVTADDFKIIDYHPQARIDYPFTV